MIRLRKIVVQVIAEQIDEDGNVTAEGPLARGESLTFDVFPWQIADSPLAETVAQMVADAQPGGSRRSRD